MAITLRNKALEAKIKEIGRRTGLGPSAVIARAIERESAHLGIGEADRERQERLTRMRAFLRDLPPPTDEERRAVKQALDEMYDENGLPQ